MTKPAKAGRKRGRVRSRKAKSKPARSSKQKPATKTKAAPDPAAEKETPEERRRRKAKIRVSAARARRQEAREAELARPQLPPPPVTCSDEELRFIVEYMKDLNGSAAMIRAGITDTPANAKVYASRYLDRPHVLMEIAQRRADWIARNELSLERVLEELRRIGLTKMSDVATWDSDGVLILNPKASLTEDQLAAIAAIEEEPTMFGSRLKVKLHDKLGALKDLRRALSPTLAEARFGAALGDSHHGAGGTATIVIEGGPTGLEVTVKPGEK